MQLEFQKINERDPNEEVNTPNEQDEVLLRDP